MDWIPLIVAVLASMLFCGIILVLKGRYSVPDEAAQAAILKELQQSLPDMVFASVVQVSDRGPFPWLDVDVGCAIMISAPIDLNSTLYYEVLARDSSGQVTTWHAKIHATFQHIRRVQVLRV